MKRILPECFSFADREVLKFSAILLLFPYLNFFQSIEAKKLFNCFIRFESQVQKMFKIIAWGIIGQEGSFANISFQVDLLRESDTHPNVIRYFCTVSLG